MVESNFRREIVVSIRNDYHQGGNPWYPIEHTSLMYRLPQGLYYCFQEYRNGNKYWSISSNLLAQRCVTITNRSRHEISQLLPDLKIYMWVDNHMTKQRWLAP